MNKKAIAKKGVVLILLIISLFLVYNILAETPEEERTRLEAELSNLTQQLIDIGYNPNASCELKSVHYENYNLDNKTGYHTVIYFNLIQGDIE